MMRFGNSRVDRALLAVLACLGPTLALAGGIRFFEGGFEEALARAEEENKHVFVDVYATWCGPCKVMDAVVFPRDDMGDHYNTHFINVKLDAEDESINGPAISDRYDVGAYPTCLYLNSDGSVVGRALGALPASLFVQVAEQLTGGLDSGFAGLEARYGQGERDPEFVQAYLWDAQVELAPDDWSNAFGYSSQLIAAGESARAREILRAALDGLEGKEGVANFRELLRGQLDRIAE